MPTKLEFLGFDNLELIDLLSPILATVEPLYPSYLGSLYIIFDPETDNIAQITLAPEYHQASIRLGHSFFSATKDQRLRYFIHELAHLYTTSPVEHLSQSITVGDELRKYVRRDVEFHTCSLARVFLNLLEVQGNGK